MGVNSAGAESSMFIQRGVGRCDRDIDVFIYLFSDTFNNISLIDNNATHTSAGTGKYNYNFKQQLAYMLKMLTYYYYR